MTENTLDSAQARKQNLRHEMSKDVLEPLLLKLTFSDKGMDFDQILSPSPPSSDSQPTGSQSSISQQASSQPTSSQPSSGEEFHPPSDETPPLVSDPKVSIWRVPIELRICGS
jgi:hypothetical protein